MKKQAHIRNNGTLSYKKEIRIHGKRVTRRFTRVADADKWYAEKKREKELIESGLRNAIIGKDKVFSTFTSEWMEKRKRQGKPFSSWSTDLERLNKWVLPEFGDRILQKISSQDFSGFLDGLVEDKGKSPATRNRVRALLHKLYNDAVRMGLIERNPVTTVSLWKENTQGFDYFHSTEDCLGYLATAKAESKGFYAYSVLALNTGARIGELLALQNQDIDLTHRRINISKIKECVTGNICSRTKAGKGVGRWLGINDEVFHVLTEHKKTTSFKKPDHFVFHNELGNSLSARGIRSTHERVCRRAGLKVIRIHDLRHTFASHYVMNGGTLNDLQALLGHSSPMMTQKYAHLAPGYLESKAKVVNIGLSNQNVTPFRIVSNK